MSAQNCWDQLCATVKRNNVKWSIQGIIQTVSNNTSRRSCTSISKGNLSLICFCCIYQIFKCLIRRICIHCQNKWLHSQARDKIQFLKSISITSHGSTYNISSIHQKCISICFRIDYLVSSSTSRTASYIFYNNIIVLGNRLHGLHQLTSLCISSTACTLWNNQCDGFLWIRECSLFLATASRKGSHT